MRSRHGLEHGRWPVAQDQRPLAHLVVDVLVAVDVGDAGAERVVDVDRRGLPARARRARAGADPAGEVLLRLGEERLRALGGADGRACLAHVVTSAWGHLRPARLGCRPPRRPRAGEQCGRHVSAAEQRSDHAGDERVAGAEAVDDLDRDRRLAPGAGGGVGEAPGRAERDDRELGTARRGGRARSAIAAASSACAADANARSTAVSSASAPPSLRSHETRPPAARTPGLQRARSGWRAACTQRRAAQQRLVGGGHAVLGGDAVLLRVEAPLAVARRGPRP